MSHTSTHNMTAIGRLHFLKGKFLHSLLSSLLHAPSSIYPFQLYTRFGSSGDNATQSTTADGHHWCTFMSLSHVLQEAIACYSKAYECYRSGGDEPHVGKSVQKISEVFFFPFDSLIRQMFLSFYRSFLTNSFSYHSDLLRLLLHICCFVWRSH
jgi:hypothetical protein